MTKPYVLGICGGSGSGKTYLLTQLLSKLPSDKLTLVSQDNYYLPYEEQPKDDKGDANFDTPKSFDLKQLKQDLAQIKEILLRAMMDEEEKVGES